MKNRGFTLVETLISATLLLMVLGIAMFGYQLYMQYWQREQSQYAESFRTYRDNDLLHNALRGIIPYAVSGSGQFGFYFLGRADGFTAVTQTPVFNPGALAVIRVFREPGTDGQFQLVYEEASLRNLMLENAEQELPFQHRMVLKQQYQRLGFGYMQVFYTVNEAFPELQSRQTQWLEELDGLKLRTHPVKIRLQLNDLNFELPVPDRQNILLQRYQQGDDQT